MKTGSKRSSQSEIASRRPWILITAASGAVLIVVLFLVARSFAGSAEQRVRDALQNSYNGRLQVQHVKVLLFPRVLLNLEGITVRRNDSENPPWISIGSATGSTGFWELLRNPVHIHSLRLEKLDIHVPPRGQGGQRAPTPRLQGKRFVIDEVVANGTKLQILPKQPNKQPLDFDIRELSLHDAGTEGPMKFQAILTNAKPPWRHPQFWNVRALAGGRSRLDAGSRHVRVSERGLIGISRHRWKTVLRRPL